MTTHHTLPAENLHFAWDNSLPPVLEIEPGDTVTMATWDANSHYYSPSSTAEDVAKKGPFRGHALTGPIQVKGAKAGATLVVEVLEVQPASWGFTTFGPGRGLLPNDFTSPYIRIWDLADGSCARGVPGVAMPIAPFCGVMGVALSEAGQHSTSPPRRVGGNMDIKQTGAGCTLYLPMEMDGALFSAGDAHAVQGDGEVCITAVEMDSVSTFRFSLLDTPLAEPQIRIPTSPTRIEGAYHGCTSHNPDLMVAAQNAIRYSIDWLGREYKLTPEDAYVVCSVAAELRISQIVDAPNWTVTSFLPLAIFE